MKTNYLSCESVLAATSECRIMLAGTMMDSPTATTGASAVQTTSAGQTSSSNAAASSPVVEAGQQLLQSLAPLVEGIATAGPQAFSDPAFAEQFQEGTVAIEQFVGQVAEAAGLQSSATTETGDEPSAGPQPVDNSSQSTTSSDTGQQVSEEELRMICSQLEGQETARTQQATAQQQAASQQQSASRDVSSRQMADGAARQSAATQSRSSSSMQASSGPAASAATTSSSSSELELTEQDVAVLEGFSMTGQAMAQLLGLVSGQLESANPEQDFAALSEVLVSTATQLQQVLQA